MALVGFMAIMHFRWLGYSVEHAIVVLIFVLVCFAPFFSDVANDNVNRIQLGLVTAMLWCLSRGDKRGRISSGFILGLTTIFKPNIVFVPLLLYSSRLIERRYDFLKDEIGGFLVGCVLGGILGG